MLQDDLQLVTIELLSTENSQEIFETLNARGTPLTAADLVRNFVFQRLEAEGGDTKKAYREDWPFETKFWTKEVSVGRYFVSRSSLFLNQWLIARTGEDISPQSTFTRFKSYVELQGGHKMADLLPVLSEQAAQYEAWTEAAAKPGGNLTVVEMSVYRMQASGVELLKPLLIWLHEPGRGVPQRDIDRARRPRRELGRTPPAAAPPGSDLGRVVADIIDAHSAAPPTSSPTVSSTIWPGLTSPAPTGRETKRSGRRSLRSRRTGDSLAPGCAATWRRSRTHIERRPASHRSSAPASRSSTSSRRSGRTAGRWGRPMTRSNVSRVCIASGTSPS